MINLILFGPPGSGKGTQAVKLVEKYNLVHISTGDLFRSQIAEKTDMGMKAKAFMDKGELVPDEVTIGMLKNKMLAHPEAEGFIFDGFPRTIPQAEALDIMLADSKEEIAAVLELEVSEEEIVERLLNRAKTSGRSDDANEDIIRNRFQVYLEKTAPVAKHYAKVDKAHKVNGLGSIDDIFERLVGSIDTVLAC